MFIVQVSITKLKLLHSDKQGKYDDNQHDKKNFAFRFYYKKIVLSRVVRTFPSEGLAYTEGQNEEEMRTD